MGRPEPAARTSPGRFLASTRSPWTVILLACGMLFGSRGDATITPSPAVVLPTPTNLAVVALSSTQVRITWTDNATTETVYTIQRASNPGFVADADYGIAGIGPNSTEYVFQSLIPEKLYYFRVRCREPNPAGGWFYSDWTSALSAVPREAIVPSFAVSATSTSATLTWGRPNGPSGLRGYTIQRSTSPTFTTYTATDVPTPTAYSNVQAGLTSNTTYYFRIRGYFQRGTMDWTTRSVSTGPPVITSFAPTSGVSGTEVLVTGTLFSGASQVKFNGVAAAAYDVTSTSLRARVPAAATSGPIQVVTPRGTATSATSFSIVKPPTIVLFSPKSGPAGTSVTLTGTNLLHVTSVSIGSMPISSWSADAFSLRATIPAGAVSGKIRVVNAAGVAETPSAFTVIPAPTISSVSPDVAAPNAVVVIAGSNFTQASSVKFNGVTAVGAIVNSPTTLTVTVPAAATSGKVSVTTAGGTGSSAVDFIVEPLCDPVVRTDRSLMITDLGVVQDPVRTRFDPALPTSGPWSFGRLMTEIAPPGSSRAQVADFTLAWLNQWRTVTSLNGFAVAARDNVQNIIGRWPRTTDGRLDLTRPPMRLLAIVVRPDLAGPVGGHKAGEGRFVFGVFNQTPTDSTNGAPFEFTVIFEFNLDTRVMPEADWDTSALGLSTFPTVTATYLQMLEAFTRAFAFRNAVLDGPNQSPLSQLRTNEIALGSPWQLREFRLDPAGALRQVPVVNTPDFSFSVRNSAEEQRLVRWVTANQAAILANTHLVPPTFEGLPFLGAVADNPPVAWSFAFAAPEVRRAFSVSTCNGCHSGETGTSFTHVKPRAAGVPATLSTFTRDDLVVRKNLLEDRIFDANCHR